MTYSELAKIFKKNNIKVLRFNENEVVVEGTILDIPFVKVEGQLTKYTNRKYIVKIDEYGDFCIYLLSPMNNIFIKRFKKETGAIRILKVLLC